MHEAVEERSHDDHVAEQPPPVLERAVGGDDRGGALVAAHEHVGELVAGVRGELAQEEVVDDQQLGGLELGAQLAQFTELARLADVLDELVGFAVVDSAAVCHGERGERFRNVALSGAGRTDEKRVFVRIDELECCELEHVAPGQPRVVAPVEALQVASLGQARQRIAPVEQARAAPIELVLHEPGEGFDEVHFVGGDLEGARLQRCGHAGQAQAS